MINWLEPQEVLVPDALRYAVGGNPLVAETLVRRGITSIETARGFLDPQCYQPAAPAELPDLEKAAGRLERAIASGEVICVWGDFDVDGQTATTLLVSALRDLGARVSYHIPVRATESHGVNLAALERILNDGAQLILTCDTGIAAHQAVAFAQERGVQMVITDHHDLPPTLPEAYAVVNPKLLPSGHPLSTLPGVGVAYKLVEELYARAGRAEDCQSYLDLVALGIVADLALQTGDTRYLLQRGLSRLRNTPRLAMQMMLELAELDPRYLTEEHIGFELGPRLNALGRLSDANPVVEFLTTDDQGVARAMAYDLEGLNARRKLLTDQVFQGALAQIERDPSLLEQAALVLSHPSWPAGVIGIVASRLVERFHKPAILISTPPDELGRGSARSVEGVNISAAIAAQSEMLAGFGGHPMAAGLAIDPERIEDFRRALSRTVQVMLTEAPREITLQIDGDLTLSELSLDLVADLERLAPFGAGNPPLILVSRGIRLVSQTSVGRNAEHLLLTVAEDDRASQRVIWWQGAGWDLPEGKFDLAYTVRASTFRGQPDLQVEWLDARPVAEAVLELQPAPAIIKVIDYRLSAHPLPQLNSVLESGEVQVWGEAEAHQQLPGLNRFELNPAKNLVVWTTPPGNAELHSALERVMPETVVLFGVDPRLDQPEAFLKRLAGLVKYVLRHQSGQTSLGSLAAATAQRELLVQVGLAWLAARGHIRILSQGDGMINLESAQNEPAPDLPEVELQLTVMLEETAAYRAYFERADPHTLLGLAEK